MPIGAKLDLVDQALIVLFMFGLYTGVALTVARGVPIPSVPSGVAGLILLIRHAGRIRESHVVALLVVLAVYLANVLLAPDSTYLLERVKGFIQLTYSFIIGYGLFLTLVYANRRQIGRLLFFLCVVIVVGCMLERTVPAFQALSDAARAKLYDAFMVYQSDRRDIELYGGVRPKLFTSEPSAVTFGFTLFSFGWLMFAPWRDWRRKLATYFVLLAAGYVAMRGPTLTLGLALVVPYIMVLEPWRSRAPGRPILVGRVVGFAILGVGLAVLAVVVATHLFAARFEEIANASDPSFFYRIIGPPLVAWDVFLHDPLTGAGLTGEEYIADRVLEVYYRSSQFSPYWRYDTTASVLTNYFWHHWIYLGPLWGIAAIVVISRWLRKLGTTHIAACWITWIILGQASGAYVSPKTWAVLLITAAASVVHFSQPAAAFARRRRRPALRLRTAVGRP
jgi:hypothetical protein